MKYLFFIFFSILFVCQCFSQDNTTTSVLKGDINGKYQDVRPVISDDGSILYFNRRFHPKNIKGEKDFQDVWKSTLLASGQFSSPKNLGEPYNDKKANDLVRASENGDSLVFVNADYKGVRTELALFIKSNKEAKEMEIDGYYNKSPYVDFDINFQENVIIMAVERKDSKGNQDLYYSIYQPESKTYSTPMNMGPVINSEKADFAPFLTKDGNTIFFVSYGHRGYGGADIFMSQRQSSAWDDWSKPENLGNVINSPYEETFVSIDPSLNYLYYDSYPSGASNRDIWKATLSEELKNKIRSAGKKQKVRVAGMNAETEAPSVEEFGKIDSAKLLASSKNDQSVFSTSIQNDSINKTAQENGLTEYVDEPIEDLSFFEKIGAKLGMAGPADITLMDAGKKGKKINKNLYFKFDSDKLQTKYNSLLKAIALEMENNSQYRLIIEGHTDGIGGEDVNVDLSCRRARNTKEALIENGIDPSRLEISCEGKERPIATNDDEFEGRELNRRVEFYFF